MGKQLVAEDLVSACAEDGREAGIRMWAALEPIGGPGAPVRPSIYAGARFQQDRRWWGDGDLRREVQVLVIDNVPSQANRLEAALEGLRPELGLPEFSLDLSEVTGLPPHLPRRLSSFRFPHRQADAYLRDAMLDGAPFPESAVGSALLAATGDRAAPLLEFFPQALLFGFWQSHLGNKRSQAKLARSWVSEIVGYEPAASESRQHAVKGDPLNLTTEEQVEFDGHDLLAGWKYLEGSKKAGGGKKQSLSEIGHGQALGDPWPMAVSFRAIEQRATISFASLRRVYAADPAASAVGRAMLAAMGIVAHVSAFGTAFSLRSGCDLRPVETRWTWLGTDGEEDLQVSDLPSAIALFRESVERASAAGLRVGTGGWPAEPVALRPNPQLERVIRATWPLED